MTPEIIIRNDIPLSDVKVPLLYGDAIGLMLVGQSLEIMEKYRIKISMWSKNNFPDRLFTIKTWQGKMYLQRLK
jgi:hypothetical protein